MSLRNIKKFSIVILVIYFFIIFALNNRLAYGMPVTEEPQTEPPITEEPQTEPPVTEEPQTEPPVTDSPQAQENNTSEPPGSKNTWVQNNDYSNNGTIDTRLSELTIECGDLTPAFSPDEYHYTVYVKKDSEIKKCGTTAVPMDNVNTIVSATGPTEFDTEDVQKKIIIEGKNGEKSEYIIDVHILSDKEILYNNSLYVLSNDIDTALLPKGFQKINEEFKGHKVKAAESVDGNLSLLCFENNNNEKLWYVLGQNKDIIYPVNIIDYNGNKYISFSQDGTFIYGGESGEYYFINKENQDVYFSIMDEKPYGELDNIFLKIIIISILCIALLITCVVILKNKKKSLINESKYFRPYIGFNDTEEVSREK